MHSSLEARLARRDHERSVVLAVDHPRPFPCEIWCKHTLQGPAWFARTLYEIADEPHIRFLTHLIRDR